MKIKNLIGILAVFAILAIVPFALADDATDVAQLENTVDVNLDAQVDAEAGVTPDSPLYGLDNAFENLGIALTFNKEKKAEKILARAQERLSEIKKMIDEGKLDKAEKARARYDALIEKSNGVIDQLESDGDENKTRDAFERLTMLQNNAEAHFDRLSAVKERILANHENMTDAQRAALDKFFEKLENKSMEVEARIDAKKEKVKIKYKALSGKTDDEVSTEEAEIEQTTGVERERKSRIENEIKRAKLDVLRARIKLKERLNVTNGDDELETDLESELDATNDQLDALSRRNLTRDDFKELRDSIKDLRENGNEISEIARSLRESREDGTFNETKMRLREAIEKRHELRKDAMEDRKELRDDIKANADARRDAAKAQADRLRDAEKERLDARKAAMDERQKSREGSSDDSMEDTSSNDSMEDTSSDDTTEVESETEVETEDDSNTTDLEVDGRVSVTN